MKCRAQCEIDVPPGTASDVSALSVCLASSCEAECGLTCGALAGWKPPPVADSCQACYSKNACAKVRACATSINCDATFRCQMACVTFDCNDSCVLSHGFDPAWSYEPDASDSVAVAFAKVTSADCATACDSGGDWECAGKVSWPAAQSATVAFHMTVKDYVSGMTETGVNISACAFGDEACVGPLVEATTNAAGDALLMVPNATNNAGASLLGVNGFLQITSASTVPDYYYWGFPLSAPDLFLYGEVITPDELQEQWNVVKFTPDPSRGTVSVAVYDCAFIGAAGVQVTLSTADGETRSFDTTGEERTTTGANGILTFGNVPAGALQIIATPTALKTPSSKIDATVRVGTVTQVIAFPTPL